MKKKRIYTEEQKARNRIYMAEYRLKNKAKAKIYNAKWYQDNKEYSKQQSQEWNKENPGYISPCRIANPSYEKEITHKHDLGYWVVYLIKNYNGLGDDYCGQTQNICNRMKKHKSDGRLNSDKYELIKQCETLRQALDFEAYMHEQGYHG